MNKKFATLAPATLLGFSAFVSAAFAESWTMDEAILVGKERCAALVAKEFQDIREHLVWTAEPYDNDKWAVIGKTRHFGELGYPGSGLYFLAMIPGNPAVCRRVVRNE